MSDDPRLAASFPQSAELGELLVGRGLTVAVAESCTGGLLAAALTAVPGSSRYMRGGVVAYADEVKRDVIGVDAELLATRGAVSPAVAAEMARGVARFLHTDLGIAVTGVAGPGAEGTSKPVGLIYVAGWLADLTEALELREPGDREANRAAAVRAALSAGSRLVTATISPT
ncbi:MAG: nicotinamide-nucleotide amidohydrolase family protein [Candidatus Dormiibacterota bacterium]